MEQFGDSVTEVRLRTQNDLIGQRMLDNEWPGKRKKGHEDGHCIFTMIVNI